MDVLLVEGEARMRKVLAEDLADAGLAGAAAPSAEATLGAAAAAAAGTAGRPPCALVTDMNLGVDIDGFALAAEARRRWPGVGVGAMTGEPANLAGCRPDPREICLLRPFGPPRLAAARTDRWGGPAAEALPPKARL